MKFWGIDDGGAVAIETVDDLADAALVSGDLARGINEIIAFFEFNPRMEALRDFIEGGGFFALRTRHNDDQVVPCFLDLLFGDDLDK